MFDDGSALRQDDRELGELPSTRCEACGARNPAGYNYCHDCGARTEATLAYGAVVHLTLAHEWFGRTRSNDESANDNVPIATLRPAVDMAWVEMIDAISQSPAELAWDSLEGEDVTAVWSESIMASARTAVAASPRAAMLIQLAADGYPGQGTPVAAAFVARGGSIDIGRACERFGTDDPYLEPWHAQLSSHAEGLQVHDPGTRGGVWMRLFEPRWLRDGDRFRVGQQFLCFDAVDGIGDRGRRTVDERGRIQLIADGARMGLAISVSGPTVIGRAGTDVVLMDDPFVSVAHCRLVPEGDGVRLEDLGSSNGTWVRLHCGDVIPFGGVVAIGQSVYRVESAEP